MSQTEGTFSKVPAHPLADQLNTIILGDCCRVMKGFPDGSVDLVLTDPPYLVNYRSRDGRTIAGDTDGSWLLPAFAEAHRVLKPGRFCISFYGWSKAERYLRAWREAGFRPVGHMAFIKPYTSGSGFLKYQHEQAYLLAKGRVDLPVSPISDVQWLRYTGNRLHPMQKPVRALMRLVWAFSAEGDVVLDPFCGSGSLLVAAMRLGRRYVGIEVREDYYEITRQRLRDG
ncbi:MAG TPA: DNA methyltransferase [Pyrinomonadaceae bacterium]